MTKIDIISGFLGAGKTTLIKKLLQDAFKGQQVVLIENEFGEIGIDGGFLKDAGIEIREMNSGCICCSLVGDFGTALKEVAETYHPDRIIIEPSGVGKLSDVIHAVEKLDSDVVLNSAVTVVDVLKCKMYLRNFGEFFKNQVEAAGTVILSRTDLEKATPEKIEQAIALIRDLNPNATIITTPVETLEGKKILDTIEGVKIDLSQVEEEHEHDENCTCGCHDHDHDHDHHDHDHHDHDHHDHDHHGHDHHDHDHHDHHDHDHHHHEHDHDHHEHDENCTCGCHDHDHDHHDHDHDHDHDHHHHHHADEVFSSWGRETVRKYSRDEIASILQALSDDESYGMVLRAKGMLEAEDGTWTYFDMVPGEADIRSGNPEYTGRICVIGSKMNEEKLEALWFQK
jgi:G3E family GTPase